MTLAVITTTKHRFMRRVEQTVVELEKKDIRRTWRHAAEIFAFIAGAINMQEEEEEETGGPFGR